MKKIIRKLFKTKKQKISEECWSLDYYLVKWVNEHIKVYRKEANEMVDLEFYKFKYKEKSYTMLELIDTLIIITNDLLNNYYICSKGYDIDRLNNLKDQMYDILKLIHFELWW